MWKNVIGAEGERDARENRHQEFIGSAEEFN